MSNQEGPISASVIVCESVLTEEVSGLRSAIRILSHVKPATGSEIAHFYGLTFLASRPGDTASHELEVRMVGENSTGWFVVAASPVHTFTYGYKIDQAGPGGFSLATRFSINVKGLDLSAAFFIEALLDGSRVGQAPVTLLR